MKKTILILLFLFIPFIVYADNNCKEGTISIKEVSLSSKSPKTVVIGEPSIVGNQVNVDIKFFELNDYVEYNVLVKNNSNEEVKFNKYNFNIDSDYIGYSVESKNSVILPNETSLILLKIYYKNEVPNNLLKDGYNENELLDLSLYSGEVVNPGTGADYVLLLIVFSLIVLGLYFDNKKAKSLVLLFILILPFSVFAMCTYKLKFNPNVTISSHDLNPCTYDGELVPGAKYVNGDYTYVYGSEYRFILDVGNQFFDYGDGWGIKLNNKNSDSITTKICSSINGKPITYAKDLFNGCTAKTIDLSTFNTSHITNMSGMFYNSQAMKLDLSSFDTSNVVDMSNMFSNSQAISLDLSNFDTSNVTNMSEMFAESQATTLDLSSFNTSRVTNMYYMFFESLARTLDLSSFDTSKVTNMFGMFFRSQATELDLSSFDASNVTTMERMFQDSQATTINLSSFDTSNVTTMFLMFSGSQAETLDLSSFDTSKVTDMSLMFENSQVTSLDLSSFDTSNVTDMGSMFSYSQATSLDLSSFNTSNVTSMEYMFRNSQAKVLNLSSFDTSNVKNMNSMFSGSKVTILDLSSFDMSGVTKRYNMFDGALATTGYARTDADAAILNSISGKPSGLVFVKKE